MQCTILTDLNNRIPEYVCFVKAHDNKIPYPPQGHYYHKWIVTMKQKFSKIKNGCSCHMCILSNLNNVEFVEWLKKEIKNKDCFKIEELLMAEVYSE